MDVDLATLPVPDWGLECPKCHYLLRGLPAHRCPECGNELDISALIRPWTRLRDPTLTGRELPVPDFGLLCRNCKAPLAGAVRRECSGCGASFDADDYRPPGVWFRVDSAMHAGLSGAIVEMNLADEGIPYVAVNEKGLYEIYFGSGALGARLYVACEFYFEFLWRMRRLSEEISKQAVVGRTTSWRCPQCGEEVPGNFAICWKCETAKP